MARILGMASLMLVLGVAQIEAQQRLRVSAEVTPQFSPPPPGVDLDGATRTLQVRRGPAVIMPMALPLLEQVFLTPASTVRDGDRVFVRRAAGFILESRPQVDWGLPDVGEPVPEEGIEMPFGEDFVVTRVIAVNA